MAKIGYYLFYSFLWLITWLPIAVLYLFSDVFYYLTYYVVGYRKKVVMENLSKSFPNKSQKELEAISKKFFRHFCDTVVEIIKLIHTSEKQLDKRITFKNIDHFKKFHEEGRSVTALMSHYANWEYIPFISCKLKAVSASIYHPLNNTDFDKVMIDVRGQFGLKLFSMAKAYRSLISLQREFGAYVVGMISDQAPPHGDNRFWLNFLNQDTAAFMGAEKIATRYNHGVVFMKMSKPKRGHYVIEIVPVTDNAKEMKEFELTLKYHELLEKQIVERPELWLWSHRRWKRKRPKNEKLIRESTQSSSAS